MAKINIAKLGEIVVFYLPANKLEMIHVESNKRIIDWLDEYLTERYGGITKITQSIEGHYKMSALIVKDEHVRYELALTDLERQQNEFLEFLQEICSLLNEASIYLSIGNVAFLICPC